MDLCLRKGLVKEENFWHTRKLTHRPGQWGASELRGECNDRCSEGKTGTMHHRDHCQTALPSREEALMPPPTAENGGGARCQGSGSSVRPQGENWYGCHKDTLRGLVQQRRESREKTGCLSVARGHCHRDRFKESS